MPGNFLCQRTHLEFTGLGPPRMGSVAAPCAAAMARSALRALAGWETSVGRLRAATEERGTLAPWARGVWGPARWASRLRACLLAEAARGAQLPPAVAEWLGGAIVEERSGGGIQRRLAAKAEAAMTPQVVCSIASRRIAGWWPEGNGAPLAACEVAAPRCGARG